MRGLAGAAAVEGLVAAGAVPGGGLGAVGAGVVDELIGLWGGGGGGGHGFVGGVVGGGNCL